MEQSFLSKIMEVTIAWFWLVKLAAGAVVLYSIYKAFKNEFKSKFWNVSSIILVILFLVNPIKINPVTDNVNYQMNTKIANSKILPELKTDDSFKKSNDLDGISKDEINLTK